MAGPSGRVIAIEPNPDNVQLIYRGIRLNGAANVEVWPIAASNRRDVFSLIGRSNTHLVGGREWNAPGRLTQAAPLDELTGILPRLDLVKLDVEGHEPLALEGFWKNVTRHRPTLVVEFNPRCLGEQGQDPEALLGRLLTVYPRLRAVSPFGDDRVFEGAGDLMQFWTRRAAEVTAEGRLPAGFLHFDLLAAR
jgi:FkbM family methyltransferase